MRPRAIAVLRWLLAHRKLVLGLYLLAVAAMLPGVARLGTDNSPHAFFLQGDPAVARYQELRQQFGSDEVVRVVVAGDGLWTPAGLRFLGELEQQAAGLAEAESANGLWGHHGLTQAWPPADPPAFRQLVIADTLDRQLGFVDPRGEVATVMVVARFGAQREMNALLDELRRLAAAAPAGVSAHLAGLPVMDEALDGSTREIQTRFFPLLVLFTILLLVLSFRDAGCVLVPLVFVFTSEILTLGPMGYLGLKLNLVLAILPPVIFVVGLATAVHLLVRYRELMHEGLSAVEAAVETYRDKGWAVFWTGMMTGGGLGSLATSAVSPIATLGIWATVGIAILTIAAFLLYPLLLVTGAKVGWAGPQRLEELAQAVGRRWAEGSARYRWVLLGGAGLFAALGVVGVTHLTVDSNALTYLAADHPARRGIEDLQTAGIGSAAVELVLSEADGASAGTARPAGERPGFRSPPALASLSTLAARLRQEPLVLGVVGAGEVSTAVGQTVAALGPLFAPVAAQGAAEAALRPFVTADGKSTRLTVFVPVVGFDRLDRLIQEMKATAAAAFPRAKVEVTGQYPLLLETQRQLLTTLVSSFAGSLLCSVLILGFLVRNVRLAMVTVIPNIWPVLGVLGAMGWIGLPLDIATVMVASVVLGLADHTVHTLGHFRELAPRVGQLEAVASTLEHTAGAYILTAVILAAGFGVCGLSSFAPTARFGMLAAVGILLAAVGDLFLVPALLGSQEKRPKN